MYNFDCESFVHNRDDHHFFPTAVETFGAWESIGHNFVNDNDRIISGITNNPKSISYIFQAISMAV